MMSRKWMMWQNWSPSIILTIPVINKDHQLEGMVVIHDVIEDLVNKEGLTKNRGRRHVQRQTQKMVPV